MAPFSEASSLLADAVSRLDISPELADEAVVAYQNVTEWLADDGSDLLRYGPELYPQGSFKLGTPVHPILPDDDFDVDLVCHLAIEKESVTQKELKAIVGARLRANSDLRGRLTERRRCWTLSYRGKFHLDILPTIPDPDHPGTGVLVTDRDLHRWQYSNPLGYAVWFYDRMRPVLLEKQRVIAEANGVAIEDVPEWRVRTPLQRAIQVLKRHRDVRFVASPDDRPISIIITTLAARAYKRQADLATTIAEVSEAIPAHIELRDGRWWVSNPAHAGENFADKWNQDASLRDGFLRWLDVLRADVISIANAASDSDRKQLLEKRFALSSGSLVPAAPVAPVAGSTSHAMQPPWQENLKYRCTVAATVYRTFRGKWPLWALVGRPVAPGFGIRFVATSDTPAPYEVRWQITNTGEAARAVGGLRGGFDSGDGVRGTTRWERTLYPGTHYIEAFVVKDGVLVARSGRRTVQISR
jgi:Adenylyl/Guanylyl and SMODS C-terminal sensor domain/Second Messenger Oligonucleotide or Dinucleotide Synthetase domain